MVGQKNPENTDFRNFSADGRIDKEVTSLKKLHING
jgi:hypothetical protein